jgi:hypothetical protein
MSQLINFQDAVTGANLDPTQTHAVYYGDGPFANKAAVAKQCPHAKLFAITVTGGLTGVGVFAIDSEAGDVPVDHTLAWLETQIKLGVHKVHPICAYANENRWLNEGLLVGVQALERKYGVEIEKWDAHYDGIATLPSWASAKQYANPGPIDRNVALANFFGDAKPVVDPQYDRFDSRPRLVFKKARRERGQVELYDRLRAQQTPTKHPHPAQLAFVRYVLAFYAARIAVVAKAPKSGGWAVNDRKWRFDQIVKRSKGQRVV